MKKFKKWAALVCAGIITASFLAGCGGGGEENAAAPTPGGEKKNTAATEEENTEKSMGRYLEREVTLPEEIGEMTSYPFAYMKMLENGDLLLAERMAGKYISSDNGETWESAGCPWSDIMGGFYITDIAISPDGGVALVGLPTGGSDAGETSEDETAKDGESAEDESAEAADAGTPAEDESAEAAESGESADGETSESSGYMDVVYRYYCYDGNGSEVKLDIPDDAEIIRFGFDNQSRLYGFGSGGKVYRFDLENGSKKELFTADGTIDFACFTDKYMVGVTTRSAVVVYDIEQDIMMDTDEVLQDYIEENLGLSIGGSDVGHSVVLTAGEQEDVVYFAFEGGLYRHVIGGTAIEQLIDGAVSTFGDPSVMLMDMVMLPGGEFTALYTGMKMYRYTYDPDVPTIPDKQLKVYSLLENTSLRQAISMFQKSHQDTYVRYEIGMSGKDSVTKEDAIRNLNTKIMSGEGPDILLLDGLPRASYEEKGVLADVSAVVESMSGDGALFPNIVEACRKDGKIYALPIRVEIPVMLGSAGDVAKVTDIASLADLLEELRAENPEGALLNMRTPEQLLYVLHYGCSAAWTDESGNIDERALEEFLTAAARIWQAEIAGVDEADLGADEGGYGSLEYPYAEYYGNVGNGAETIAMGAGKFAVGKVGSIDFEYDMVTTLAEEGHDIAAEPFGGQVKDGFIPSGLAGIAANSVEDETALEFYRYLFGKELQDMNMYNGLPVNMASFEELKNNPRAGLVEGMDERYSGSISAGSPDGGEMFSIELLWPTEEEFQKLRDMVSSASAMSTGDATIESTVYEIGPRAMAGSITPKEAVEEIVKKSAIYLAE